MTYQNNWGEDRAHYLDSEGRLTSIPAGWTDVVPQDPFVVISAGRADFHIEGLSALVELREEFGECWNEADLET